MNAAAESASQSDEQLALLVRANDPGSASAYAVLYKRHAPSLLAFLASRTRDRNEAADLCQQVWLKIWQQLQTRFDANHFRGWIFQMARNLLIDQHRRRRPAEMPEAFDPTDSRGDPERDCIDARVDFLRPCVEGLAEDRRRIVQERLSGQSFEAISERLGIPPNTAMTRFHRAKDQLRECIEERSHSG
jgi:RNA polymerase sigma-70 factor (ECF subfamily)